MKIFLVIPTLEQGGAERIMSELANNFSNLGHHVHLCLLTNGSLFYSIHQNVIIHRLGFRNINSLQKVFSEVKTFFELRKLLRNEDPDVVLSFMEKFNILTILASSFLPIRVFISDRCNPFEKQPFSIELGRKIFYKHATGIIAQTDIAKIQLERKIGKRNIRVIPNPIRELKYYPLIEKENIILNVGRLVDEKGQSYLLKAFAELSDDSWKLVILGEGYLRDNLYNLAISLGISDRVYMPGAVDNVDEWLSKSSVFVFSSISEGFPNALVEAMSAGLPCISFDCDCGPRDIIVHDHDGYLIESKNVFQLTQKLRLLCSNEDLRIKVGENAKEIRKKLNPQNIVNRFMEFFKPV